MVSMGYAVKTRSNKPSCVDQFWQGKETWSVLLVVDGSGSEVRWMFRFQRHANNKPKAKAESLRRRRAPATYTLTKPALLTFRTLAPLLSFSTLEAASILDVIDNELGPYSI